MKQSGHHVTAATSLSSHAVISQGLLGPSTGLNMLGLAFCLHLVNNPQSACPYFADEETEAGK